MSTHVEVFRNAYVDSVVQLGALRAMRDVDGVEWATVGMGTPANVASLREEGAGEDELRGAGAEDFLVAVRAASDEALRQAVSAARDAAFGGSAGAAGGSAGGSAATGAPEETPPRTLRDAVARQQDANLAVVSVPGEYAALSAYQALSLGLHVLLFSDNVPVAKEVALKDFARSRGLLLMGPGAGTAILGGVGLGFANVVRRGPVGIVAAAGTGAQEAACLLDQWGVGVSHVVGLGGRDLSSEVGGRTALSALEALRADPATEVVLIVSKPPAAEVAAEVLAAAAGVPLVAALIGTRDAGGRGGGDGAAVVDTLEGGVLATLRALGRPAPETTSTLGPSVLEARGRLPSARRLVRGLFSGGSLCYESLVLLARALGPVYSNTP
ncbi:MAG TPA: FdrA family protein, partial [Pedococcus sp.]